MSIPLELIDQVCLYVPLDDLCRVARSSSVLCAVAQRFLYQDVSIDSRSLALTLTLANKPHIARHVRAFTIALAPGATLLPAYFRALTTAISHMHEIVSLSIALPERLSRVLLTHQGTVFPSLRRFQASFALDPHLIQFLGKAPGLRSLTLDQTIHVHNTEIPSSLLPNLTSFSGSSHAAQTLVPGRPVSTIFLTSGDLTLEVVSDLAKSSAPIATLDGTTTLLPLPILESLSASMPELENIRLTTTYNLWDEFFSTVSTSQRSARLISL